MYTTIWFHQNKYVFTETQALCSVGINHLNNILCERGIKEDNVFQPGVCLVYVGV